MVLLDIKDILEQYEQVVLKEILDLVIIDVRQYFTYSVDSVENSRIKYVVSTTDSVLLYL